MPDDADARILELMRGRKPGHSLEAPFYTDSGLFATDMAMIFGRHWLCVGVEPDLAEPGDAMTVDVGPWSVVIVRDDDMAIRAFHNVCRHRGARLVQEPKAVVGNLVCPYHSWTYGLDGRLLFADHMGPDFDKSCHGLKPVALRSIGGLLFICLAEHPPADIDDMAAALAPYLAPHDVANCKVAHQVDLVEACNWKLTLENNRECYHCAANHPELTIPLFANGFGFAPDETDAAAQEDARRYDRLVAESCERWKAAGIPGAELEHLADCITGFRTQRLPIDQAGESQTLDTRVASRKLLGRLTDPRLGGLSMWTQPNSWHHFMSDHVVTFCVLPLDAGHTLVRTKWLVHKEAVEGVDYDLDNLTAVWNATNAQDAALVERAQQGVANPSYEPGPYSIFTEGMVEKFMLWYLGRLSAHIAA